jgi:hypothetical protein
MAWHGIAFASRYNIVQYIRWGYAGQGQGRGIFGRPLFVQSKHSPGDIDVELKYYLCLCMLLLPCLRAEIPLWNVVYVS